MVQKSKESEIDLSVKKVKYVKKRTLEAKTNNIDKELKDMIITGSIIIAIYGMEYPPANAWNIGLESDKYGAILAEIHFIDTAFIREIINSWSTKNIKEVLDNYSCTHIKYPNEYFKIIENAIHLKKQKTIQYTTVNTKLLF